jgi:hypothetical protein
MKGENFMKARKDTSFILWGRGMPWDFNKSPGNETYVCSKTAVSSSFRRYTNCLYGYFTSCNASTVHRLKKEKKNDGYGMAKE